MESTLKKLYEDIMTYLEENDLVYLFEEGEIGFISVDEDAEDKWDFSATILEAYNGSFPWSKHDEDIFESVRIWGELWKLLNPEKEPEYLED